ncbi:MAG: methylenetetrahydrofolate--tRNA-(uracil(54)-C(5))-methyltransferase (FADH(2)-oxidizing) TrmFO [Desulfarculus sp.]|nr:MAG: methylenetetrahydrofolate--tRNA-(uracil(54)-C(5))-methyltransferase (FADH(2)-oxidizing) TrmFO [Desulfarculus sp.]
MGERLLIIGGGLAGCEAALQAASRGLSVELVEMKPAQYTPAHSSPLLGELVCSNSLRSAEPTSAVGLLKVEMAMLGSIVMQAAAATRVGAGRALAVDRQAFAAFLDAAVSSHPLITRLSERRDKLPAEGVTILATGPLTSEALSADLAALTGSGHLHFYDAIAPIVTSESVDLDQAFWGDRYGDPGQGDYLNCPLSAQEYAAFYAALMAAEQVPLRPFESPRFFEGCLPIEVMAARGEKTLLFGPMKPVGLTDPATGQRPFAVVQLRKEDAQGLLLNLVGFQTKLSYAAQERVLRLIPALARAEFARLGSIHRNTFIEAPRVLRPDLRLMAAPHIFVAGQLSGVEGYVESAASGLLCGLSAANLLRDRAIVLPPATTALGGLLGHLRNAAAKDFQPSNVNFGLLEPLPGRVPKRQRGAAYARRALTDLAAWMDAQQIPLAQAPPELA